MKFLLTLLLMAYTSLCSAATLQGIVTYVYDGDTLLLQADQNYYRIRLTSIDAPELDQPYGLEAKRAVSKLVLNKAVIATLFETDKYNRHLGKIYIGQIETNKYLLAQGLAWHYTACDIFDEEFTRHMQLENYARNNKLGLWSQSKPTPPWVWRKRIRLQGHSLRIVQSIASIIIFYNEELPISTKEYLQIIS